MKPERTLYDVLEVSQSASAIVVKAAYRSLAQSLHPDKHSGAVASGERLAEINDAYSVVSDPARRQSYDQTLGLPSANPERRGMGPSGNNETGPLRTKTNVSRPFGFRPLE